MKNLLLFLLAGILGGLLFRFWQAKKAEPVFVAKQSSFVLKPASEALVGELIFVKGKVEKESREKEEFEPAALGEEILQGEKIATGEKSQAQVQFPDFAKIDIGPNSEVGFANLLPANFLIEQRLGEVSYKILQKDNSLSVRSLHVLITFSDGEGRIMTKDEVTIEILSGEAKLALVDLENETHVWQLKKGQKASIDDAQRSVEIK